ncbi:pentatricopeptide repeat superfamily protein [Tanacetum coccineum]
MFVGSNLADLYSKCESLLEACMVFEEISVKDEVSWNSMINGYVKNGCYEESLVAFRKMLVEDVMIDHHLLCSALCACGGFKAYDIGRCLHAFVLKLGLEFNVSIGNAWMDMYSCRKYGDKKRGQLAAESLKKLEHEIVELMYCMLSSIIYAKEQQWENVRSVRKTMKDENVKKLPGYSWVDVDIKVYVFEDWCHPHKKEIDLKLDSLEDKIVEAGYVPDTESVPLDLEYDMKVWKKVDMAYRESLIWRIGDFLE